MAGTPRDIYYDAHVASSLALIRPISLVGRQHESQQARDIILDMPAAPSMLCRYDDKRMRAESIADAVRRCHDGAN